MIQVWGSVSRVRAGTQPGEGPEIVDEMRLVEVAAIERDVRPIDLPACSDSVNNLLESTDAAEQFRSQSDLGAKDVSKAARA